MYDAFHCIIEIKRKAQGQILNIITFFVNYARFIDIDFNFIILLFMRIHNTMAQ